MMFKKWKKVITYALCGFLLACSFSQISAATPPIPPAQLTPLPIYDNHEASDVSSGFYLNTTPDNAFTVQVSLSLVTHKFAAYRRSDGAVRVLITESYNSSRGYYQHWATDENGQNFVPSKDAAYFSTKNITYQNTPNTYEIIFPADSVSKDGYVYLQFYLSPYDDLKLNERIYAIPVDYDSYKVTPESYKTAEVNKEFQMSASATFAKFSAYAFRNTDGTVDAFINISNSNANFWIKHEATGSKGDIFIPSRDSWFNLTQNGAQNHIYRMTLPKDAVSTNGYVYLDIYFNLPNGLYKVDQIKVEAS